ncbi:MAG: hypothetical protein CUN49_06160 [Candidatus Thermofonsia Clade 1 bacterium]|uniref:DUF306 domain-containing protein n=1 Tax=Candidatus Thermofonsia Clade 1 bacterium TaxID=2364210 RepID=A0A2M8PFI3_9CHLR|nr:MAG: hypothetical protein CUN49_06160 [Candidatus Thermofonsia Clade 1 bacterium]RMF50436.1 MAG: META domain-containing protein [Chloroflexota bacterium]
MRYLIGTLVMILAFAALPIYSYAAADPNRLVGTQWKLLRYGAVDSPTQPVGEQPITLIFSAQSVGGTGSCNTYGGNYRVEGQEISFSNIFSTLIACQPEAIAKQEQAYFQALRKATRYRIVDGLLIISYGANEALVFTRLLNFADSTWRLIAFGEREIALVPLEESLITLRFRAESVGGSSGCNTYKATPIYRQEALRFEQITSTQMACSEALMMQERAYLEALSAVRSYRIVDGLLVLNYGADGRLIFERVPTFTEWAWQLTAYGAPNALNPAVGEITLRFAERRASGSTGCNQYSATFEVSGDSLSFRAPISTRRACETPALSQQEQAFLKALEGVTHYSELGEELTLYYGANERLIFKRAQ